MLPSRWPSVEDSEPTLYHHLLFLGKCCIDSTDNQDPVRFAPILNLFTNPERFIRTRSVQTRTGLTKPTNLPAWGFGLWILNRLAKPYVSLAQTVFRLAVNLELEMDCQTRWFLWPKLFLDCAAINSWRSFRAYKRKQTGSLKYFEISANRTGPKCSRNMAFLVAKFGSSIVFYLLISSCDTLIHSLIGQE